MFNRLRLRLRQKKINRLRLLLSHFIQFSYKIFFIPVQIKNGTLLSICEKSRSKVGVLEKASILHFKNVTVNMIFL